ncbi:hypothetical protein OH76DRAFT_1426024 [Lentinus brumalis]|uniref:Uncharacterized protein n=1 Tax=Lentinus brumalis TaxID=2498619 RepID=A0A371DVH2_9APHY|nr:hypothetical protein OH76DRAFT_1426024 [Polyporus brumalis]
MDFWPGYFAEQETSSSQEKRKGKAQDKRIEGPWRYPVLDHGSLAAATLVRKAKRYEWSFAADIVTEYKLIASESPAEVFPPTRPKVSRAPKITPLQRAEQGAQFIRTYYPDVDIPAELIRAEIAEDDKATQTWKSNDIFSGNLIDVCTVQVARKHVPYLAFPMGETNSQLNMSPLTIRSRTKVDLKPRAAPVHTFQTPIRQIVSSPHVVETGTVRDSFLGVRTMGSATIFKVKASAAFGNDAVETSSVVTVQRSSIGDRQPVDMTVLSSSSGTIGYVVNDMGDIYRCGVSEGKTTVERVHARDQTGPLLCHVAACSGRDKLVATFDTSAFLLDFRTGKEKACELYTVPRADTRLTFIDAPDDTHTVRLTSTDEILWLDDRNTRRPLLAVKHGRAFDISLAARSCGYSSKAGPQHALTKTPLTFLTSRRNSLVTIYDVSRTDRLVQMRSAPFALPPIVKPDGAHGGYALQPHALFGSKHLSVFQLSERGSVSVLHLDHSSVDATPEDASEHPRHTQWPAGVQELARKADTMRADQGSLAERAHSMTDLQPVYHKLFVERNQESISAQSNAVFDTIERMPAFWQDSDAPVDHVLTTFDIALRSGAEPSDASRNDWFTGSALDSAAGYRAWGQGRVPREELAKRSPWHLDVSSSIRRHVPEFAGDPHKTLQNLACYDLSDGPHRTADSFRRETEARSQLALDLSLAADVFASQYPGQDAVTSFDEDVLNISLSTQAMSLGGDLEPPPVQFSFLRPNHSKVTSSRQGEGESDIPEASEATSRPLPPLGVRLLLQEWEVGTDPNHYVYRDPYDDAADVRTPAAPRPTEQFAQRAPPLNTVPTPALTQRPPAIATAAPRAAPAVVASQPLARRPLAATRSQDALPAQSQGLLNGTSQPTDTWAAPPSSQEHFAATQVLPGPHGGRPNAVKKKPAKKRVGGF